MLVMEDLLKSRSFSLNFLFLLSVPMLALVAVRYRSHPRMMFLRRSQIMKEPRQVDDPPILMCVLQVAALECVDLPLQVGQSVANLRPPPYLTLQGVTIWQLTFLHPPARPAPAGCQCWSRSVWWPWPQYVLVSGINQRVKVGCQLMGVTSL